MDAGAKRAILQQLTEAEGFEAFCQKRYVGTKRFGLEGGEVTIPALHAIIATAAAAGAGEIVVGMPHRGRLNTLVNILRKPFTAVFSEFGGESFKPDDVQGSGDVKYHLGTSTDVEMAGHNVHISLQPNPFASGSGGPGSGGEGAGTAGQCGGHEGPAECDGHPDAWGCGVRRAGAGVRDDGNEPVDRVPDRGGRCTWW